MQTLKPLMLVLSAGLLQACAAPSNNIAMEPVLRVLHSSEQTGATYYQLGKYHQERGHDDLALQAYRHSIALDSRQLNARNALASVYAKQGKLDEAKALLIELIVEYPEVAHPHNNLGYVYFIEGNFNAAVQTLKHAMVLDSKNERTRNNLRASEVALAGQQVESTGSVIAESLTFERVSAASLESPQSRPDLLATAISVDDIHLKQSSLISQIEPQAPQALQALQETQTLQTPKALEKVAIEISTATKLASTQIMPAQAVRFEVSNGNGISGMARWVGNFLSRQGIAVSRLTNEQPYTRQETKIQYRPGFEQSAEAVKQALQGHAVIMSAHNGSDHVDVRLILGQDTVVQFMRTEQRTDQLTQQLTQLEQKKRASLLALKSH